MAGSFFLLGTLGGSTSVTTVVTVTTPVIVNVEAGLLDAVNVALYSIGDERIASLDDDSDRARKVKAMALALLDARLEEADWNFARRRATLAGQGTTPLFEYNFQFILPTDPYCLHVRKTSLSRNSSYSIEQNELGQRVLLAQESTCSIVYTARIANPALWSPLFREWYEAYLAHALCYGITSKADLAKLLWDKATAIGKKAKARDGQEGRRTTEAILTGSLTDVRP